MEIEKEMAIRSSNGIRMTREAYIAEIIMEHLNHYGYGTYNAMPTENTRRLAQEIHDRLSIAGDISPDDMRTPVVQVPEQSGFHDLTR